MESVPRLGLCEMARNNFEHEESTGRQSSILVFTSVSKQNLSRIRIFLIKNEEYEGRETFLLQELLKKYVCWISLSLSLSMFI